MKYISDLSLSSKRENRMAIIESGFDKVIELSKRGSINQFTERR